MLIGSSTEWHNTQPRSAPQWLTKDLQKNLWWIVTFYLQLLRTETKSRSGHSSLLEKLLCDSDRRVREESWAPGCLPFYRSSEKKATDDSLKGPSISATIVVVILSLLKRNCVEWQYSVTKTETLCTVRRMSNGLIQTPTAKLMQWLPKLDLSWWKTISVKAVWAATVPRLTLTLTLTLADCSTPVKELQYNTLEVCIVAEDWTDSTICNYKMWMLRRCFSQAGCFSWHQTIAKHQKHYSGITDITL